MSQSVAESKTNNITTNNSNIYTPCNHEDQHYDNFKLGQKYPTPAPGNGDRVFYETLYKQKPNSEMAQEWCIAYGILDVEEAIQLYKQICTRKGIKPTKINSPIPKSKTNNNNNNTNNNTKFSKKRILIDDDVECDTGVGVGGGWEGQGSIGL